VQQLVTTPSENSSTSGMGFRDPLFVLCNGRSGSTLLRFILDAHPDLACPPETNLPTLCAQLARVWSLIEGAPLSPNRGDEPPIIPEAAIIGIRETVDRMVGSYLARRGKSRYCDKSLGTAEFTELLLRVYPRAKFVCLYRHPMDVIASGLEACPFGLNGYGFDPYISTTPGNAVLALARFWVDNTTATMAAEQRLGDQAIRVRYEDLVSDPENVARRIFSFLGVDHVPGISSACFSGERERFGPGDYKIWFTSAISDRSVGRGWSVPTGLIWPQVLTTMNELTSKLGYLPADDSWGNSAPPADLRQDLNDLPSAEPSTPIAETDKKLDAAESETRSPHSLLLGARLQDGVKRASPSKIERWEPHSHENMVAVSIPSDPDLPTEYWLVEVASRAVSLTISEAQEDSDWDVIGSSDAWERVISGELNLSVAMRTCQLRYCDDGDSPGPIAADRRINLLADLLGLNEWSDD
jgi:hypothetical protein